MTCFNIAQNRHKKTGCSDVHEIKRPAWPVFWGEGGTIQYSTCGKIHSNLDLPMMVIIHIHYIQLIPLKDYSILTLFQT
jgi:hypothetical protein